MLILIIAKEYGDAFSLKVLNQTIIVLNTPSMMKEVIEKRNASSSNRPKSILADMITPKNMNMGTGRFGWYFIGFSKQAVLIYLFAF